LTIRYYAKDIEDEHFKNNIKLKKNILHKKKIINEKNNLKKYKKKLDNEKKQILSIIDELSNINYEIDSMKLKNNKVNSLIPLLPNNNIKQDIKQDSNAIQRISDYYVGNRELMKDSHDSATQIVSNVSPPNPDKIKKKLIDNVSTKTNNFNFYDEQYESSLNNQSSSKIYYDMNKKLVINDNDLVDGMYIEPPYT
jgi:prefoldin subunit 5